MVQASVPAVVALGGQLRLRIDEHGHSLSLAPVLCDLRKVVDERLRGLLKLLRAGVSHDRLLCLCTRSS